MTPPPVPALPRAGLYTHLTPWAKVIVIIQPPPLSPPCEGGEPEGTDIAQYLRLAEPEKLRNLIPE